MVFGLWIVMVTKRHIMIGLFLIFGVLIVLTFVSATIAKIGNGRMVLYPELINGKADIEKSIRVINSNDFPVNITLEKSQEYEKIITIEDKNFILRPNEEKEAKFNIHLTKPGNYTGKIMVYFTKLNETKGIALASIIVMYARGDGSENASSNKNYQNASSGDFSSLKNLFNSQNPSSGKNKLLIMFSFTGIILVVLLLMLIYYLSGKKKKIGIKDDQSASNSKIKKLNHERK